METKAIEFEQASAMVSDLVYQRSGSLCKANRFLSYFSPRTKRWVLRNQRGLIGFVSVTTGKAWLF